jgi:hypothetical protein
MHKVDLTAGRLERVQRRVEHKVQARRSRRCASAQRDKDVLEVEQEEIRDELDDVMTQKRQEELRALHLQVEAGGARGRRRTSRRDVHKDEIKKPQRCTQDRGRASCAASTRPRSARRSSRRPSSSPSSERDAVKLQDAKDKQFLLQNEKRELAREAVQASTPTSP